MAIFQINLDREKSHNKRKRGSSQCAAKPYNFPVFSEAEKNNTMSFLMENIHAMFKRLFLNDF